MHGDANIAAVAALIADPARAAMLTALADGGALPAGELAFAAVVTPQSASGHLAQLVEGGLLAVEKEGRHRYYRLSGRLVAQAIERLAALSPQAAPARKPLTREARSLRFARRCYDHLAGQLGVAVAEAMEHRGLVRAAAAPKQLEVTERGRLWLAELGIGLEPAAGSRRPLARRCLDWTERRHHIAGALGGLLLERFCALGWTARQRASRAVRLTLVGQRELRTRLGIDTDGLEH
jgi:DNA-binding transcriptional ArsR family regulator